MTALLEQEVSKLSRPGKLALIERLWQELEKLEDDVSFDEPPAWHQAILEERCKAFEEGKETSRSLDDAIKELKIELGIKD